VHNFCHSDEDVHTHGYDGGGGEAEKDDEG
jgi:hypothetical protein